jgi:hypothetical protein
VIIWIPAEIPDSELSKLARKPDRPRSIPGPMSESKTEMPEYERIPSEFGYTVVEK